MWVIDLRDIVPFISSHDFPCQKTKLSRMSCGRDQNNQENSHERLSPAQVFIDQKGNLYSMMNPVLQLGLLLCQIDSFLEVGVLDDLLQR